MHGLADLRRLCSVTSVWSIDLAVLLARLAVPVRLGCSVGSYAVLCCAVLCCAVLCCAWSLGAVVDLASYAVLWLAVL